MEEQGVLIRQMFSSDIPGVYNVQAQCYSSNLLETEEVFASKREFCPDGCYVAEDINTKSVIGYIVSHPWKDGVQMELHNSTMDVSSHDIYYVHDTAVLQPYRSLKLGSKLLNKALEQCKYSQFSKIKLVSLPPALNYWKNHGFEQDIDESGKPSTYGEVYPMSLYLLPSKHLAESF